MAFADWAVVWKLLSLLLVLKLWWKELRAESPDAALRWPRPRLLLLPLCATESGNSIPLPALLLLVDEKPPGFCAAVEAEDIDAGEAGDDAVDADILDGERLVPDWRRVCNCSSKRSCVGTSGLCSNWWSSCCSASVNSFVPFFALTGPASGSEATLDCFCEDIDWLRFGICVLPADKAAFAPVDGCEVELGGARRMSSKFVHCADVC